MSLVLKTIQIVGQKSDSFHSVKIKAIKGATLRGSISLLFPAPRGFPCFLALPPPSVTTKARQVLMDNTLTLWPTFSTLRPLVITLGPPV